MKYLVVVLLLAVSIAGSSARHHRHPPPPTAILVANPTSITAGQSSTLSWSSTNATSCTGNNFATGNAVSGSVSVAPPATTTYSVSCSSAIASATVVVGQPSSGVGPTGPVGPVATTCSGVALTPGTFIQSAVDNNPTGTVFCLAAGTYAQQNIVPKTGNKFIGALGAILDGQNTTVRAFDGGASDVVIQNLVIQNYTAGFQDAPIFALNAPNWKIISNEIRNNAGVGVLVRGPALVQFNNVHHNLEMGYGSDVPGSGIVLDSNEFAFNNYTDAFDPGNEAGGGKLWATTGAQVTHNYSHDNHGNGMWDDTNNTDIVYAFNRVENNTRAGIMHEIGYNASIHDNLIRGNGSTDFACSWLGCGGVVLQNSGGVNGTIEVFNNTIVAGAGSTGIGLIEQGRGSGSLGPYIVQNVWAHDNTIDLSNGNSGGVEDTGDTAIFTSRNNRFDFNIYTVGNGEFWWNNGSGGKAFWQGFGLDPNGVFYWVP